MGYVSEGWKYRIKVDFAASMFDEDLNNWTAILTHLMVPQLNEENGPLDTDGTRPALVNGGDIRAALDAQGDQPIAVDIRNWNPQANHEEAQAELAIGTFTALSGSGVSIYIFWATKPPNYHCPAHYMVNTMRMMKIMRWWEFVDALLTEQKTKNLTH
jgi:hypothetical protein